MSNLKKLEKELDETLAEANKNLGEIPPSVRGGWAQVIAEAKVRGERLVTEYTNTLMANAVAIFIKASPAKSSEFEKVVKESGGLVLDATALYNRLTDSVFETLASSDRVRGTEWGVAQTQRLHSALMQIMHELKIPEWNSPRLVTDVFLKNRNDVYDQVRAAVEATSGMTLSKRYLELELYRAARIIRYNGNTAPVFIINATEEETKVLGSGFGKGVSTATLKEEDPITQETIASILKETKKQKKQDGEKQ